MEGFSPNESQLLLRSLKLGILFSSLTPCILSDSFFKKKKRPVLYTQKVCCSGKHSSLLISANVGNCFCDVHTSPHFDIVQISVGVCTYGNISFFKV